MECPSSDGEKHVCRLQDQVSHVGPCDDKYFICVKSRRDWYIRSCEFFERKNPNLTAMITVQAQKSLELTNWVPRFTNDNFHLNL